MEGNLKQNSRGRLSEASKVRNPNSYASFGVSLGTGPHSFSAGAHGHSQGSGREAPSRTPLVKLRTVDKKVQCTFTGKQTQTYDLVVGADGSDSRVGHLSSISLSMFRLFESPSLS